MRVLFSIGFAAWCAACAHQPVPYSHSTTPASDPVVISAAPVSQQVGGPFVAPPSRIQTTSVATAVPAVTPDYVSNLKNCLSSYYGCRRNELSPEDAQKVHVADYHRNLSTCSSGNRFGCKHDLLNAEDLQKVREKEYQANLRTCLSGYSFSCKRDELNADDKIKVAAADYNANLNHCLSNQSYLCKLDLLTEEDRQRIPGDTKSATASPTPTPVPTPVPGAGGACAENGSCYGDISALTGNPKTTHVNGYYRRDGTYVRSHYRSGGRR